jgi:hypothetical protein
MDMSAVIVTLLFYGAAYSVLVCGTFGAYVAGQKGRGRLEGFMFGFLLGPLGVVAVACLPTIESRLPNPDAAGD